MESFEKIFGYHTDPDEVDEESFESMIAYWKSISEKLDENEIARAKKYWEQNRG